jgi:hypothetical protein
MAKKQKPNPAPADNPLKNVSDYRFPEATRKNDPPAKIAAEGYVPLVPKAEYLYSPRRPPVYGDRPRVRAGFPGAAEQRRELRRWASHVCRNPQLLDKEMEYLSRALAVES